ncbi:MAG: GyrI-like domain-containing protein [Myxococcales bacterium FL481]|nr:MAG: GyrI-like domain-containing protein [Myxococcales bacterium FL481]
MPFDPSPVIETRHLPRRHVAFVRHVGPYMGDQALFGRLFGEASAFMQARNLWGPSTESLSIYHDDPETVPPAEQRISVGYTVPEGTEGDDAIQIMELPAGEYLVGSFELDPQQYGEAWGVLMQSLAQRGLMSAAGLCYESGKNDPEQHPQGKHIVDLCVALTKA